VSNGHISETKQDILQSLFVICGLNTGIRFQTAWHRHTPCPKKLGYFYFWNIFVFCWPIFNNFSPLQSEMVSAHKWYKIYHPHLNCVIAVSCNFYILALFDLLSKNEKDVTVIVSVFANSDTYSFTYCEIISTWCQLNAFRMILLNSAGQCICIWRSWNCQLLLCRKYFIMDARSAMRPCYILPMFF